MWGPFKLQFSEGFQLTLGRKGTHSMCLEFLIIVSFWLLTKTSSRIRGILGKFQGIKTKVNKKRTEASLLT